MNDLIEDLSILGSASCFMWRHLNRVIGYFEATVCIARANSKVIVDLLKAHMNSSVNTGQIPMTTRAREHACSIYYST